MTPRSALDPARRTAAPAAPARTDAPAAPPRTEGDARNDLPRAEPDQAGRSAGPPAVVPGGSERGSSLRLDLERARAAVREAERVPRPGDRFLAAHVAALRAAAVVLALRARPGLTPNRPRNAWRVVADVAPEFGEWAAFFAATQSKREAVRAGAGAIVSGREADDLVRDAQAFLALVERAVQHAVDAEAEHSRSLRPRRQHPEPAAVSR